MAARSSAAATRVAAPRPGSDGPCVSRSCARRIADAVWLLKGNVETGTTSEAMITATRSYVAAFLDANLRGEDLGQLLAGSALGNAGSVVVDGSQPLCTQP
jgi:hypothetical protein